MFNFVVSAQKNRNKSSLVVGQCCLLLALLLAAPARADVHKAAGELVIDIGKSIELLVRYAMRPAPGDPERPEPFTFLLQDLIPALVHQRPSNENGTRSEFMEYDLEDHSNDEAVHMSLQELIERSGYRYELFDAVADDGYITQMTHLINPLVDSRKLRQPPILMEHGGTIDPTAYLIASSIQHHPEAWPRTPDDGPITSWNRSLAFVLANHGFDVWLAETRGSNDRNRRHLKTEALRSVVENLNEDKNMSRAENINEILRSWNYWGFSQDDLIAHELKSHVDTVLKLTGAQRVHLMTFSLSTPTSLAFLSSRPDYAGNKIAGYISMAPIISGQGTSLFTRVALGGICNLLPNPAGHLMFNGGLLSSPMRQLYLIVFKSRQVRYSLGKALVNLLMGASAKWQTLLDDNVMGHLFRTLSFRELKQMCQHIRSNRFAKFDYGPAKNRMLYNQTQPPAYDLSNLNITDWIVVSAANDALATQQVYEHLYEQVNPKPVAHVVAPGFNHLDLIAGWGNDKYVNLPILRYLQRMSSPQSGHMDEDEAFIKTKGGAAGGIAAGSARALSSDLARTIDLKSILERLQSLSLLQAVDEESKSNSSSSASTAKPLVKSLPLLDKSQQVAEGLIKSLLKLVELEKSHESQAEQKKEKANNEGPLEVIKPIRAGLLKVANTPAKLLKELNLADLLNMSLLNQLSGQQQQQQQQRDKKKSKDKDNY